LEEKFSTVTIGRIVELYTKKAGIPKRITPHCFRHSCATHLLSNEASLRHIQELLGHASLDSTQIYTTVAIDDLKKVHAKCHPRNQEKFLDAGSPEPSMAF
jgi:integrase/recombinase XerD